MGAELLGDARFHRLLQHMDEELAQEARVGGCRKDECGGVLHSARYRRKPRGMPAALSAGECWRLSFCCAREDCRTRTTPASVRFLGRKVYLTVVVTLISIMRSGATPQRMQRLKALTGVSHQSVLRWQQWWQQELPQTSFWRSTCAAFNPPVLRSELPGSLMERFTGDLEQQLLGLLRFLRPLSGGHRDLQTM